MYVFKLMLIIFDKYYVGKKIKIFLLIIIRDCLLRLNNFLLIM